MHRQRLQVIAKVKSFRGCLASRPCLLDLCQSGPPSLVNRRLTHSLSQKSRELCAQVSSPLTEGCDLHILPKTKARPATWLRYPVLALSRSWGSFRSKRWTSRPLCPVRMWARAVWAEMSFPGKCLYTERVIEQSGTGQGVGRFLKDAAEGRPAFPDGEDRPPGLPLAGALFPPARGWAQDPR